MSESNSIRILTEPAVYLVGKQVIGEPELDRFLADHGVSWESDSEIAAEVLTETAGRICYMSFAKPRPGGNAAYLTHIKEVGHGSVLEHAVWNFIITGVSRSLTHELVRHRAGLRLLAACRSATSMSRSPSTSSPTSSPTIPELHAIWLDAVKQVHEAYIQLAEKLNAKLADPKAAAAAMLPPDTDRTTRRKAARQAARSVLPNATETKIFVTANARACGTSWSSAAAPTPSPKSASSPAVSSTSSRRTRPTSSATTRRTRSRTAPSS